MDMIIGSEVFCRSAYNYDRDLVSEETGLECKDPSKAQQHQKEEADINTIVKRFGLTGELPNNVRAPQYGDFTGLTNYQEALNAVKAAENSFMAMPAYVRARFENDPHQFVAFCSDPANIDEIHKLGLTTITQEAPASNVQPSVAPETLAPPTGGPEGAK